MTSPIPKTYTPTVYYDGQAGGTPVDADNLNKTEQALMNAFLRAMMFDVVPTAAKTGTYNANPSELVLANALSAAFPVILPAAYEGALVAVKKTDSSANLVNIQTTNSQTIDGSTTAQLRVQNECRFYRGTAAGTWITIAGVTPISQLDARYSALFAMGAVARQKRTVAATASTVTAAASAVGIIRLPTPVTGGRTYKMTARCYINSTTAIQGILQVTYTTDGTNATPASTLWSTATSQVLPTTGTNIPFVYEDYIGIGGTTSFTISLCLSFYNSAAGTINMPGSTTLPITFTVEDVGLSSTIVSGANL